METPQKPGDERHLGDDRLLSDENFASMMQKSYRGQKENDAQAKLSWARLKARTGKKPPYPLLALAACLFLGVGLWSQVNAPSDRTKGAGPMTFIGTELTAIGSSGDVVTEGSSLNFGDSLYLSLSGQSAGSALVIVRSPTQQGQVLWQGPLSLQRQALQSSDSHNTVVLPLMEEGAYKICSLGVPSSETSLAKSWNGWMQSPEGQAAASCLNVSVKAQP